MKRFTVLALLLLTGCTSQAMSQSIPVSETPSQEITVPSHAPQRLELKLTLSSPDDLKVREGDGVSAGQILSDRVRDRQRLAAQKRQLEIQIQRLQQPVIGAPAARSIPNVAAMPPASFLDEVAEVERQRVAMKASEMAVSAQQRMLDLLQATPSAQLPEATIPHEQEVLKQKQQELDQARSELQLAQAKLAQAQQDRQYQEYLNSLELSKRVIAINQAELQRQEQMQRQQTAESDRSFQVAQLQAQLQNLDAQLFTLSAIRSPYAGTIQRIRYQGQSDQNLTVQLTLVTADSSSKSSAGTGTANSSR